MGRYKRENGFDHVLDHPFVQYELEKYTDNQYVINRLAKNGQRYLFYTVSESINRNLELSLFAAFIESQFDPYAQSSTGASEFGNLSKRPENKNLKKTGGMMAEEISLLLLALPMII